MYLEKVHNCQALQKCRKKELNQVVKSIASWTPRRTINTQICQQTLNNRSKALWLRDSSWIQLLAIIIGYNRFLLSCKTERISIQLLRINMILKKHLWPLSSLHKCKWLKISNKLLKSTEYKELIRYKKLINNQFQGMLNTWVSKHRQFNNRHLWIR